MAWKRWHMPAPSLTPAKPHGAISLFTFRRCSTRPLENVAYATIKWWYMPLSPVSANEIQAGRWSPGEAFHTPEKGHDHDPGIPECCHPDDPSEGYQDGIS